MGNYERAHLHRAGATIFGKVIIVVSGERLVVS